MRGKRLFAVWSHLAVGSVNVALIDVKSRCSDRFSPSPRNGLVPCLSGHRILLLTGPICYERAWPGGQFFALPVFFGVLLLS